MPQFVILFAAVMLCFGGAFFLLAHRIEHWPTVAGTVTESRVRIVPPAEQWRAGNREAYEPVIVYDYVVHGIAYRGRKIGYGSGWESERSSAEAVIAAYPVGRTVRVLFNPADPRDAYLGPGHARGVAWTCIGAALVLTFIRWRPVFAPYEFLIASAIGAALALRGLLRDSSREVGWALFGGVAIPILLWQLQERYISVVSAGKTAVSLAATMLAPVCFGYAVARFVSPRLQLRTEGVTAVAIGAALLIWIPLALFGNRLGMCNLYWGCAF